MNSNNNIKVLIVDDSAFMRKILTDMLNSNERITVIGTAKNGLEAIKLVKLLKPDVVTMDVEMPTLNGIEALSEIMKSTPVPVIMLSSLTGDGAESTLTCLDIGAVDFIQKPSSIFKINVDDLKNELINKINIAVSVKSTFKVKNTKLEISRKKDDIKETYTNVVKNNNNDTHYYVLIGTSTGGPKALQQVIPLIPKNIKTSILIVQHMPAGFTKSLATRLNKISDITVKEAEHSERILPGYAYIAPGNYHLGVKKMGNNQFCINLSQDELVSGHRPSVTKLFESIADNIDKNIIAVVMTGMGADGADGVKKLKNKTNSYIIAQDEKTSVVHGMPKSAINTGTVDDIVPLDEITNYILKKLGV